MSQVCPRCAAPAADHDQVCRACGLPLVGAAPSGRRGGLLIPVVSGIVGVLSLLVIFVAFIISVGSMAGRASGSTPAPAPAAGAPTTAVAGSSDYPAITLKGRFCSSGGTGAYGKVAAGNDATPCEFAANIQSSFRAQFLTTGQVPAKITAYNAASGAAETLSCSGIQPVTCTGGNNLVVFLYGGEATFTN